MPYFQRKPIEQMIEPVRSQLAMPALPSRMPARNAGSPSLDLSAPAGIVEQAAAVLAAERPNSGSISAPLLPEAASIAPTGQDLALDSLRTHVNRLVEELVALAAQPPTLNAAATPAPHLSAGEAAPAAAGGANEPAPVLSPNTPIRPGNTAEIRLSLINEDSQTARIAFLSTGLVGETGERIPAERISFEPQALTLQPGASDALTIRIAVPVHSSSGVYSGLIRASQLDYLHAVVMLQVQRA